MRNFIILLIILFFVSNASAQKFELLAKTPPMGWNSWNKFACEVSEKLIIQMVDVMINSGMKDLGYEYIVLDDCWQVGRDKNGDIVADSVRFPHGLKYLADYIHSKGLKFGIYSCAGTKTCMGRPGSLGHEYQDARSYARWGVDYLKYDWCYTITKDGKAAYTTMRDALFAAGRPMVFSLCEWGYSKPWEWGKEVGQLWRTTIDIRDRWDSMLSILDQQKGLENFAGPGRWNDPDMLEVGNGGMTTDEYKSHFSLWCMLSAPLMAGNDLENMTPETSEILKNAEIIALDQDSLGKQGYCYRKNGDYEIWIKKLANNEKAACLLNRSDEKRNVQVDFALLLKAIDLIKSDSYKLEDYKVRDLWEAKELSMKEKIQYIELTPHSVKVFRFIRR